MDSAAPPPSPEKVVEIDSLYVNYGKVEAVRGISFEIPQGEVFGFIGPNGAGKSSTIKVLSTLLRDFRGTARVTGIDVRAEPQSVRESTGGNSRAMYRKSAEIALIRHMISP